MQFVSLTGSWITTAANAWLIYELTGKNLFLGLSAFCAQVPTFLVAPFAGVLVDRWNVRRTLLLTQSVSAAQSALLAVLAWTGVLGGLTMVAGILALQLLQGLINAIDLPARQSFAIQMVDRREDLPNAIALNSMIVNLSRFAGPALAGLVLAAGATYGSALTGPAVCYSLDACSYAGVLVALYWMSPRETARTPKGTRYLAELGAGVSYIRNNVVLRTALLAMCATSFLGVSFNSQLASVAKSHLGVGPAGYGYLFASVGVGATLSALFLATRRTIGGLPRLIAGASMVLPVTLLALSFTRSYSVAVVLVGVMGAAMIMQSASTNTLCQTLAGDAMRGRVMSFFTMSFMGTVPLGALAVGLLAERLGIAWTLRAGGVALLVASVVFGRRLWWVGCKESIAGGLGGGGRN